MTEPSEILFWWQRGNDTTEIANILGTTEAEVYRVVSRRNTKPAPKTYDTYYENRFARKDRA